MQVIPLGGLAAKRNAEISGMAWYGDTLILLPQYPDHFYKDGSGVLFGLPKQAVLDYLDGKSTDTLLPLEIPFDDGGASNKNEDGMTRFEGFEALAFSGERVFLTIESQPKTMLGYLAVGSVQPGLSSITLDRNWVEIQPQAMLDNYTDEALLVHHEQVITIYEANGAQVNPNPTAHVFDLQLNPMGTLTFPNIEYRITDATPPDKQGRFWAINYLFPGDLLKLQVKEDPLAAQYGEGPTHSQYQTVERLVQFQISDESIHLVKTPPVQLALLGDAASRNWEGLAILDGRGFLLVTDLYPETILGFVPFP